MSRVDELNNILSNLKASTSDIEACAVVSEDGLIIASALPQDVEEARVAAMSAAILSIGTRTVTELSRGKLERLLVDGDDGNIVIMHAGEHAALVSLARKNSKLGLIFLELTRAAEDIKRILS